MFLTVQQLEMPLIHIVDVTYGVISVMFPYFTCFEMYSFESMMNETPAKFHLRASEYILYYSHKKFTKGSNNNLGRLDCGLIPCRHC